MSALFQLGLSFLNHLWSSIRRFLIFPIKKISDTINSKISAVRAPTNQLVIRAVPAVRYPSQPCKPITILSANLWHDWPWHRQMHSRLDAFAKMAESTDADIVLLQEVSRTSKMKVDVWLAERLGMGYTYARANGHEQEIGFEEGLAVFSRFPLETPQWLQLGVSACQMTRRMALGARVKTPCGSLVVFSVHLGIANQANIHQVNHLQKWIGATVQEQTAVIGGDFNVHEHRSQIRGLQHDWLDVFRYINPTSDGVTHELRWPWGKSLLRRRLDYMFMQRGGVYWDVLDAQLVGAQRGQGVHSDHRAVLARILPVLPD